MKQHQPREETGRVLGVAAALWGSVVAMAALEGAFSRFDALSLAALGSFVSLFAVAGYLLDPQLRAYSARMGSSRGAAIAAGLVGAFAVALALGSAPFAMFLAPLAAFASAAAAGAGRPRGAATPVAPAKSPGATPAAT